MPSTTAQIETALDTEPVETQASEPSPQIVAEDLDLADLAWIRGDHRLERDLQMYEAGHRYRDFL